MHGFRFTVLMLGALVVVSTAAVPSQAENWSRFRGDNGTGVSGQKGIPATWSEGHYAWSVELPGLGHAAPVIWDDNLFITSASEGGRTRYLFCLDPASGKEKWAREIALSESHKHSKSSWASSTPVTDGELVYVSCADVEQYLVSAYDYDGNLVWRRGLGPYASQHNLGVSLMLFEDMLIVPNDQDGPSSILAFDKHTGATRWSTIRDIAVASYATPIVAPDASDRPQIICVSGAMGITSINPANGVQNWRSQGFPLRTVASPVYGEGLLIASCGQGGRYGVQQIAVDATGNLDADGRAKIVWERTKMIPYVPTPVVYEGHLYEWSDEGIVVCVDLKTGEDVWTKRVGGNYSGSPICIDGKLYCIAESGEVVVVKASTEFEELGRVQLDGPSHSTPAVANGRLFLRTFKRLSCVPARDE